LQLVLQIMISMRVHKYLNLLFCLATRTRYADPVLCFSEILIGSMPCTIVYDVDPRKQIIDKHDNIKLLLEIFTHFFI